MKKIIITVVGKDTVGIIAKTSAYLAKNNLNILDISQTVVGGYFNMMLIADGAKCKKTFDKVQARQRDGPQDPLSEVRDLREDAPRVIRTGREVTPGTGVKSIT